MKGEEEKQNSPLPSALVSHSSHSADEDEPGAISVSEGVRAVDVASWVWKAWHSVYLEHKVPPFPDEEEDNSNYTHCLNLAKWIVAGYGSTDRQELQVQACYVGLAAELTHCILTKMVKGYDGRLSLGNIAKKKFIDETIPAWFSQEEFVDGDNTVIEFGSESDKRSGARGWAKKMFPDDWEGPEPKAKPSEEPEPRRRHSRVLDDDDEDEDPLDALERDQTEAIDESEYDEDEDGDQVIRQVRSRRDGRADSDYVD